MNAVHPRRYDNQIQNALEPDWQPPVGMMKERCGLEGNEEHDQHYRGDAEEHHCKRKKPDGKNHLAEMESRGGAHVEVKIGVMHVMKSPEKREHVIGPVPPPIGVIQKRKCGDDRGPSRQSEPVQQTDMSILRPHRHCEWDWQHGETDDGESWNREHKVAHQPMQRAEILAAQRKTPLQPKQRNEYARQQWPAHIIHQRNSLHSPA